MEKCHKQQKCLQKEQKNKKGHQENLQFEAVQKALMQLWRENSLLKFKVRVKTPHNFSLHNKVKGVWSVLLPHMAQKTNLILKRNQRTAKSGSPIQSCKRSMLSLFTQNI